MKKLKVLKKVIIGMLLICMLLQGEKFVLAKTNEYQVKGAGTESEDNNSNIELNKENVKKFIDEYFQSNMVKWNVPGVAVSVVKNGEELYKVGYGVSDIETQKLVDPDSTTFPAASVSKLFTATAIMQLYQSGKVDLNEDIQKYLDDISIKNSFNDTITCQNLLTHSSGLDEESELDGSTLDKDAIKSPKQYFEEHIPTVVIQPNTVCQYSNMGYNLLGYIVEKESGETYEEYVTDTILKPLRMDHSSIRIENNSMASGYEYGEGHYQKMPFAYQYTSGSSGVISTVTDMEKFMIMHLNHGTYENSSILDSTTEAHMQEKQFANNEVFEGMGEGFFRDSWNGVQIIKHEGALPGFTATLLLLPEQNFGIYVATNSLGGMIFDFEEAILTYFYGNANISSDENDNSYDISQYVGTYRSYDGVSMSNISKIFASIDNTSEFTVRKNKNGKLVLTYYDQRKEKVETSLIHQSDDIFVREDGKGYITFRKNSNGDTIYAFNNVSHLSYMKIGIFEKSGFICSILLILICMLLGSSILILINQIIRRKKNNNSKLWIVNCFINLIYIIGFIGIFGLECYMIINYDYSFVNIIYILLTVLLFAIVLNIIEMFVFGYGIIKKNFDMKTILKMIMIQTLQILFIITINYFNMVGYHIFK